MRPAAQRGHPGARPRAAPPASGLGPAETTGVGCGGRLAGVLSRPRAGCRLRWRMRSRDPGEAGSGPVRWAGGGDLRPEGREVGPWEYHRRPALPGGGAVPALHSPGGPMPPVLMQVFSVAPLTIAAVVGLALIAKVPKPARGPALTGLVLMLGAQLVFLLNMFVVGSMYTAFNGDLMGMVSQAIGLLGVLVEAVGFLLLGLAATRRAKRPRPAP